MKLPDKFSRIACVPKLTRTRIVLAIAVATTADSLQFLLGPFGWVFGDQIIDVVVMALVSWIIGFHILFLPSFVIELVPVLENLPTWTACVITVIALRRRGQRPAPPSGPTIDI